MAHRVAVRITWDGSNAAVVELTRRRTRADLLLKSELSMGVLSLIEVNHLHLDARVEAANDLGQVLSASPRFLTPGM